MIAITTSSSISVKLLQYRDFAFGEQGASPLHPDRQGAGAVYGAVDRRGNGRSAGKKEPQ